MRTFASTLFVVIFSVLLTGCPDGGPLPPVTGGYPTQGHWVLTREPQATIAVYGWNGSVHVVRVSFEDLPRHPITGGPLLTLPLEEEFSAEVSFEVNPEFYTQGTLTFDPPVAGELTAMRMQASRTPEETEEVRRHGPMANFSRWTGAGPRLPLSPTGATDDYSLSTGAGWFGCSGGEEALWMLSWDRGHPWILRKQFLVSLVPGAAEEPPGTCIDGLRRLQEALRAGTLPELDLWRQLSEAGALQGPLFDDVLDFSTAVIAIEYVAQ